MGVDVRVRGDRGGGELNIPNTGGPVPSAGSPVATGDLPKSSRREVLPANEIYCSRCSRLVAGTAFDLCGRCLGRLDGGVQFMDHVSDPIGNVAVVLFIPWALLCSAVVAGGAVLA